MAKYTLIMVRQRFQGCAPGKLTDTDWVVAALADCWDDLAGSSAEGMTPAKLHRMEAVEWDPPKLTFLLERHGATVKGSTRASVQQWTVDIEAGIADCQPDVSYRQLHKRDASLLVQPLADEIAALISDERQDPRLVWLPAGKGVRVLVSNFVTGQNKADAGRPPQTIPKGIGHCIDHVRLAQSPRTT